MLRVEGFSRAAVFQDITFTLHAGEVLTFFGLVGAGRTEVARALMGLDHGATGQRLGAGPRQCTFTSPTAAMKAGLAYLSEDRKNEGLFLDKTIMENFLAPNLDQVAPGGWLQWNILQRITTQYTQQLDVRTPSLKQKLRNLSGGNQQKVFLGEWLATRAADPDRRRTDARHRRRHEAGDPPAAAAVGRRRQGRHGHLVGPARSVAGQRPDRRDARRAAGGLPRQQPKPPKNE